MNLRVRLALLLTFSMLVHAALLLIPAPQAPSAPKTTRGPVELELVQPPPVARTIPPAAPRASRKTAKPSTPPAQPSAAVTVDESPVVIAPSPVTAPLIFTAPALTTRPSSGGRGGETAAPAPFIEAVVRSLPRVDYPAEARLDGIEGVVKLWVEIDAKGIVTAVTIRSAPDASLGKAARDAMLKARFESAKRGGESVSTAFEYSYRFELRD